MRIGCCSANGALVGNNKDTTACHLENEVLLRSQHYLGSLPLHGFSQGAISSLEEIQVLGDRLDYSLSSSASPTLVYGKSHFQSFEPQAAGDMLRRVPGVAFSGDVGELEAPQLRGLGAQYTQVLINGKRIPGNGSDRSVLSRSIPSRTDRTD